jgi:hypothetical protein
MQDLKEHVLCNHSFNRHGENSASRFSVFHCPAQLTRHQAVFDAKSCRVLGAHSRLVCYPLRHQTGLICLRVRHDQAASRVFLVGVKNRLMPRELAASVLQGSCTKKFQNFSNPRFW